jgi:hypothetical protein
LLVIINIWVFAGTIAIGCENQFAAELFSLRRHGLTASAAQMKRRGFSTDIERGSLTTSFRDAPHGAGPESMTAKISLLAWIPGSRKRALRNDEGSVARMERSAIRVMRLVFIPDFAALHPGYDSCNINPETFRDEDTYPRALHRAYAHRVLFVRGASRGRFEAEQDAAPARAVRTRCVREA